MTLTNDKPCSGGCGKVRSILYSDSPKDWLCNECRTKPKTTYHIVEFDANDCPEVIENGLSRNDARKRLAHWRANAKELGASFRYIMVRDTKPAQHDSRTGDYLWTGNIRSEVR